MKKNILIISLLLFIAAQIKAEFYFYVQLKNKNNTPYSITQPSAYLSQKALERRTYFNVQIDSTDLPVNQTYLDEIRHLNMRIHSVTKWLNGVTVALPDSSQMSLVRNLPFVRFVQYTGKTGANGSLISRRKLKTKTETTDYGTAATQINQLNGTFLHNAGFRGQGMLIAVIDAGFSNVNTNIAFDSLRNENRIIEAKDFVSPSIPNLYTDTHGAAVLSSMAANIPGTYVGTAPKASYILLRSEAAATENLCEPDFWISAIEFADSIGVDVSTTSLGYTEFDDPVMNYKQTDLNGTTARASIAANIAYNKGILVFNSSGNEGSKPWRMISVPSDAANVICVGAGTSTGTIASFSSYGTPYGNVKPELCAQGASVSLVGTAGSVIYSNGTSFSCPILAGMSACYLQAAKVKAGASKITLDEIKQNLFQSANYYNAPDLKMGYGIPDFNKAYLALRTDISTDVANGVKIFATSNGISVLLDKSTAGTSREISIYSYTGSVVYQKQFNGYEQTIPSLYFSKGFYIVKISIDNQHFTKKIILN